MIDSKLLYKIVWSFKRHSRESIDDLFQEAFIGYMEALSTYDSKRGAFSTYIWKCVSSRLRDYIRREMRKNGHLVCADETALAYMEENSSVVHEPSSFFETLPIESQKIAEVILNDPNNYLFQPKEVIADRLKAVLVKEERWTVKRFSYGLNRLQMACI